MKRLFLFLSVLLCVFIVTESLADVVNITVTDMIASGREGEVFSRSTADEFWTEEGSSTFYSIMDTNLYKLQYTTINGEPIAKSTSVMLNHADYIGVSSISIVFMWKHRTDVQPPAEDPSSDDPPADNPPADNPPAEEPTSDDPPADNPPTEPDGNQDNPQESQGDQSDEQDPVIPDNSDTVIQDPVIPENSDPVIQEPVIPDNQDPIIQDPVIPDNPDQGIQDPVIPDPVIQSPDIEQEVQPETKPETKTEEKKEDKKEEKQKEPDSVVIVSVPESPVNEQPITYSAPDFVEVYVESTPTPTPKKSSKKKKKAKATPTPVVEKTYVITILDENMRPITPSVRTDSIGADGMMVWMEEVNAYLAVEVR